MGNNSLRSGSPLNGGTLAAEYLAVYQSQKTGILTIHCQDGERVIKIDKGVPVFASSDVETDKLHHILIKRNLMTMEQFSQVENTLDPQKSVGKNLVDMGVITQDELVSGAREQVFHIFSRTFDYLESKSDFEETTEIGEVRLPVSYPRDFFRAVMSIKEKKQIANQFSETLGNVFRPVSGQSFDDSCLSFDTRLNPVFPLFDGEKDLAQLFIEADQLDEFSVMKLTFAFWSWGLLEEVPVEELGEKIQKELEEAVGIASLAETTEVSHIAETTELRAHNPPEALKDWKADGRLQGSQLDDALSVKPGDLLADDSKDEPEIRHQDQEVLLESIGEPQLVGSGDHEPPFYKRKIVWFNVSAAVMIFVSIVLWGRMRPSEPKIEEPSHQDVMQEVATLEADSVLPLPPDEDGNKPSDPSRLENPVETPLDSDSQTLTSSEQDTLSSDLKESESPPLNPEQNADLVQDDSTEMAENRLEESSETEDVEADPGRFRSPVIDGPTMAEVDPGKKGDSDVQVEEPSEKKLNHVAAKNQPDPLGSGNPNIEKKSNVQETSAKDPEKEENSETEKKILDLAATSRSKKNALELMNQGEFEQAADVWEGEYSKHRGKFTLALELVCQKQTVINGYQSSQAAPQYFVLQKKMDGKACFWVCWGSYTTREEAEAAISSIPDFFKYDANPSVKLIGSLIGKH